MSVVVNKLALKYLNSENYLQLSFVIIKDDYGHVFFSLYEYAD